MLVPFQIRQIAPRLILLEVRLKISRYSSAISMVTLRVSLQHKPAPPFRLEKDGIQTIHLGIR